MGQIDGLQALRAIAVFLVAWTHCGQIVSRSGLELPHLGIFGVDIFFVISGFILSLLVLRETRAPGPRTMWEFLRRRVVRIFPVYLVFALFPLAHYFYQGPKRGLTYLPAIFLLPGLRYPDLPTLVNFSWTLIFEMFFYLVFAALLLVVVRRAAVIMACTLLALVLLGRLIDFRQPILIVVLNPILLEFAFGVCVAMFYSRHTPGKVRRTGMWLTGVGWALACLLHLWRTTQVAAYEYDVLTGRGVMLRALTWGAAAGLIVAGTVFWSPSLNSLPGRVMILLGNSSYSAYLLSGYLLAKAGPTIFNHVAPHGYFRVGCAQLGLSGALLGLGTAFYFLVEKPLLRAANRFVPGYRGRQQGQVHAFAASGRPSES